MADQVIIEFVGDTTKLEEAYSKLHEQVTSTGNLNKESAAAFKNANADIASSFEHATDECKKFNEQLRNLNAIIAGGVLKNIVADLKAVHNFYSALCKQVIRCNKFVASISLSK